MDTSTTEGLMRETSAGTGAEEREKKNPANVWPLPRCVFEAASRDGLRPCRNSPTASFPLASHCQMWGHSPRPCVRWQTRGPQRASARIINRDASDAFSRSPDRSNTMFIFTASFLLGGQRLRSFNLYICLCV